MIQQPGQIEELTHLATEAFVAGHLDTAMDLCLEALRVSPEHVPALLLRAEIHRERRDHEAATLAYQHITNQHGHVSKAWSGQGVCLFEQGLFDAARGAFHRALRIDPKNADALYGRALVRERAGDTHGARRDYLRAFQCSSLYPVPGSLSEIEAEGMLKEAARAYDPSLTAWLEQTPVLVVDVPDVVTCDAYEPRPSPAELLGHFVLPEHNPGLGEPTTQFPATVILYRRNLERYLNEREQLLIAMQESILSHAKTWLSEVAASA